MVERPIKRSERLEKAAAGDSDSATQPSVVQPSGQGEKRPEPRKGGKGKGKGGSRKEEAPRQAVNPALMRGPKPTKPKPVVEAVLPETEVEATSELPSEGAEELAVEAS